MSILKARSFSNMPKTSSLERPSPGDERTSLTGQGAVSDELDENGKRKLPPKHTGTRFKAVGTMVLAMRRFQGTPWAQNDSACAGGADHCAACTCVAAGPAISHVLVHWVSSSLVWWLQPH